MEALGGRNIFNNSTINVNQNGRNIQFNTYNTTPSGPSTTIITTPPPPQGFIIQALDEAKVQGKLCIGCEEHMNFNERQCNNCHIFNGRRGYIKATEYETPSYPPPTIHATSQSQTPQFAMPQQSVRCDTPPPPLGHVIQQLNEAQKHGKRCWHCQTLMNYQTTTCPCCYRSNGHRGYVLSAKQSNYNNDDNAKYYNFQCMLYINIFYILCL